MHPDRIKGIWKQFKGNSKQLWGKITFDEPGVAAGKNEHLSGHIQELNGIAMEDVRARRTARGNSKQEISSSSDTPEIEIYNSPNLETYAGSISTILLNSRNEGNQ